MCLANRSAAVARWAGLVLGLWLCSLPLVAVATPFKPPRRGIPGRREGGGTRDPQACVQGNPARLIALMPQTNLGLTTHEYPRFFWYMPKTRAKFVEFALYETNENQEDKVPIYTATFGISGQTGIASLTLPANSTIPPLVVGKDYRWSFALICNPNDRKRDIEVEGWVQRITPDATLAGRLARANAADRVTLYADNGLWFDTLTTLAELRCARPGDATVQANWVGLLKSVKLDAIAEQPLIQQCSPSRQ